MTELITIQEHSNRVRQLGAGALLEYAPAVRAYRSPHEYRQKISAETATGLPTAVSCPGGDVRSTHLMNWYRFHGFPTVSPDTVSMESPFAQQRHTGKGFPLGLLFGAIAYAQVDNYGSLRLPGLPADVANIARLVIIVDDGSWFLVQRLSAAIESHPAIQHVPFDIDIAFEPQDGSKIVTAFELPLSPAHAAERLDVHRSARTRTRRTSGIDPADLDKLNRGVIVDGTPTPQTHHQAFEEAFITDSNDQSIQDTEPDEYQIPNPEPPAETESKGSSRRMIRSLIERIRGI